MSWSRAFRLLFGCFALLLLCSLQAQTLELYGYGQVKHLSEVSAHDAVLQKFIHQFEQQKSLVDAYAALDPVLAQWSGLNQLRAQAGIPADSTLSDEDKMWITQRFSPKTESQDILDAVETAYRQQEQPYLPRINRSYVNEVYEQFKAYYLLRLLIQTAQQDGLTNIGLHSSEHVPTIQTPQSVINDLSRYINGIDSRWQADRLLYILSQGFVLKIDKDALFLALDKPENIAGYDLHAWLQNGFTSTTISAQYRVEKSNSLLWLTRGDDHIQLNRGSNTLVFSRGIIGHDSIDIHAVTRETVLRFDGIENMNTFTVRREQNDLILRLIPSGSVRLPEYYLLKSNLPIYIETKLQKIRLDQLETKVSEHQYSLSKSKQADINQSVDLEPKSIQTLSLKQLWQQHANWLIHLLGFMTSVILLGLCYKVWTQPNKHNWPPKPRP